MTERPGIMFYFSVLDDLKDYTTEEIGQIFLAMMKYGFSGEITGFSDRGMRTLFNSMMRYVDRDLTRYADHIDQRKYAVYCRETRKKNEEPLSFEVWKQERPITTDNDRLPPISGDIQLSIVNNQKSNINNHSSIINNHSSIISKQSPLEGVQGEPKTRPVPENPGRETKAAEPLTQSYVPFSDEEFVKEREKKIKMLERREIK